MLLLSHFSRVRLCVTPQTTSHQAPPSLGFSRQEHWSGLPFPSPMHESEKWKWSRSVVSDSSDPMDCRLPGSSIHGIFQARVLEWGVIALSDTYIHTYIYIYITVHQLYFTLKKQTQSQGLDGGLCLTKQPVFFLDFFLLKFNLLGLFWWFRG